MGCKESKPVGLRMDFPPMEEYQRQLLLKSEHGVNHYTLDPKRNQSESAQKKKLDAEVVATPTSTSTSSSYPKCGSIAIAIYNYTARDTVDLTFLKGDTFEVLGNTQADWWSVRHHQTGAQGFVPRNFVIPNEDWFFNNINRPEAESLLLASNQKGGTFIIRFSDHSPTGFSLSVKDFDDDFKYRIKHYKINVLADGSYYIASNQKCATLSELVATYTKNPHGLCHVLGEPCIKPASQKIIAKPRPREPMEIEVWSGVGNSGMQVAVRTVQVGSMTSQEAAIFRKFSQDTRRTTRFAVCSANPRGSVIYFNIHD